MLLTQSRSDTRKGASVSSRPGAPSGSGSKQPENNPIWQRLAMRVPYAAHTGPSSPLAVARQPGEERQKTLQAGPSNVRGLNLRGTGGALERVPDASAGHVMRMPDLGKAVGELIEGIKRRAACLTFHVVEAPSVKPAGQLRAADAGDGIEWRSPGMSMTADVAGPPASNTGGQGPWQVGVLQNILEYKLIESRKLL